VRQVKEYDDRLRVPQVEAGVLEARVVGEAEHIDGHLRVRENEALDVDEPSQTRLILDEVCDELFELNVQVAVQVLQQVIDIGQRLDEVLAVYGADDVARVEDSGIGDEALVLRDLAAIVAEEVGLIRDYVCVGVAAAPPHGPADEGLGPIGLDELLDDREL